MSQVYLRQIIFYWLVGKEFYISLLDIDGLLKETNIDDFDEYEVGVREILSKIIEKGGH